MIKVAFQYDGQGRFRLVIPGGPLGQSVDYRSIATVTAPDGTVFLAVSRFHAGTPGIRPETVYSIAEVPSEPPTAPTSFKEENTS